MEEKIDNCLNKCFIDYYVRKAGPLVKKRCDSSKLNKIGMEECLILSTFDVREGFDSYARKKIRKGPVMIFDHNIICMIDCLYE